MKKSKVAGGSRHGHVTHWWGLAALLVLLSTGANAQEANMMVPPRVVITDPADKGIVTTTADSITVSGTAHDDDPVVEVRWKHARGISGQASGIEQWITPPISLDMGSNQIRVTAVDAAGNETYKYIVVMREAAPEGGPGAPASEDSGDKVDAALLPAAAATSTAAAAMTDANADSADPRAPGGGDAPAVDESYTVGPGDVLEISLWKDESLSRVVSVLPDGNISFPLMGAVHVDGKTVSQIREMVAEQIGRYVPEPVVAVSIQQVNSLIIYIIGRVNRPGNYPLRQNVDVLQALTMAGGLTPFAEEKNIKVFRKTADGGTEIFAFNYKEVTRGENMDQNVALERGDIIVVP